MVTIASLWLPILVAAVLVFIASSVVWMFLPHHKSDFKPAPDEEALRAALKGATPGAYMVPHAGSPEAQKDPAMMEKYLEGPNGFINIVPSRAPGMGKKMILTFGYYIVAGIFVSYLASRSLSAGADYMDVFRFTSVLAFMAYAFSAPPAAIWFGLPWSHVAKNAADSLLYGLLTGGVFGWLWP
jgi:hypothetical protein